MGDQLFEKFLEDAGLSNIGDVVLFVNYYGIARLLAEFETWLAYNGWLRDEDEGTGDEGDEYADADEVEEDE